MSSENPARPRIGIPWRTSQEETGNVRAKLANYENAVRTAGGDPVPLSLLKPEDLIGSLAGLDGFVLPGSPADVAPKEYGAMDMGLSAPADPAREATDRAILRHAFAEKKPVLAICYGCQSLNVYLGGTLIQDLRAETGTAMAHRRKDSEPEAPVDPWHPAQFEPDSRLAALAGGTQAEVNSSHHQAVRLPGRGLEITAHAADGTVEAVEWQSDSNWVMGVQWHPERMNDAFTKRLFEAFVTAARAAKHSPAALR
jgi:putative glutamine amidotransferase